MRFPLLYKAIPLLIFGIVMSCSKSQDFQNLPKTDMLLLDTTSNYDSVDWGIDVDSLPRFEKYRTRNVIILVIDGPRYSETWGDSLHVHVPILEKKLSKIGVINSEFYNLGVTNTTAGHTAITTGNYQKIHNGGMELPRFPSIFQYWAKNNINGNESAYVIASKDKLEVLGDTDDLNWSGQFMPSTDCGISGIASGYRADEITYSNTLDILSKKHPGLVLINLKDPDFYAHKNDWENYIKGIEKSDAFTGRLWDFLQNDPFYSNNTSLFITNDHGRHGDGNRDGFISHGDGCLECRHINFFAAGPDFKQNIILDNKRSQIDIAATVAELLGFGMPYGQGEVMYELLLPGLHL